MRRIHIGLAVALLAASGAGSAAEAPSGIGDAEARPSAALLLGGALGGGSHYAAGSISFGIGATLMLRYRLLLLGGTADTELYLRGYGTSHMGVLVGAARSLVPWIRLEALAEIGTHRIDGVGGDILETKPVSPNSARLPYAGVRLGLLSAFPALPPHFVTGFWLSYREDLTRKRMDVVVERLSGLQETHRYTVGGRDLGLIIRAGIEF